MEIIHLNGLRDAVSALGFGCASLGSRVSAREGGRSLHAALERGITWFDLAPAYGAGQAEAIFGQALSGQRDRVQICTKVGLSRPAQPFWKPALMPVARRAIRVGKPLRERIRRSGLTRPHAEPVTPDYLRTSLEESLDRLRTDHVDLYALHGVAPEVLADEAILEALREIRGSGKARAIGVASEEPAVQLALSLGEPFNVVQVALGEVASDFVEQAHHREFGVISHGIFGVGVGSGLAQVEQRLQHDAHLRGRLSDSALESPAEAILLGARLHNPSGVTVCSMMSEGNLAANSKVFETSYALADQVLARDIFGLSLSR